MSITVRGLGRSFGGRAAVANVSFDVAGGAIVGLIGPNGSGKTTLLRMLSTFLAPTAGSLRVAGFDGLTEPLRVRQSVGYLPETPPGCPEARVDDFLLHRARLKGLDRRARRGEIDRCLAACRLESVRRRIIGRLSQGYRRRVGLADALLGSPPVLLLDEPTVGLDPLQVRQTRELLQELGGTTTILLSTHLLTEAEAVCQRALMLVHGRLVSDVPLVTAGEESGFEIVVRGASVAAAAESLALVSGVRSVAQRGTDGGRTTLQIEGTGEELREAVVRACVERGWGVSAVRERREDLESQFVRATAAALRREAA